MKILVLGAGGMLGSTLFRLLPLYGFDVYGTLRQSKKTQTILDSFTNSNNLIYNIDVINGGQLSQIISSLKPNVVINCIGVIKQLDNSNDPLYVLPINSLLPHRLAELTEIISARLIHISTDCVFSGEKGNYLETDKPDADDLYGKSKELGEVKSKKNVITLRTSLIGHELQSNLSLVDWFLSQNTKVFGYKNAIFSGLTTVEMANVIHKFIIPNSDLFGLFHLAVNPISKYDLLMLIRKYYNFEIEIIPSMDIAINRSLNSKKFYDITGYSPPSWEQLILELKVYHNTYQGKKNV
jgi:dTDP-4-dehydrorhamnose reductase